MNPVLQTMKLIKTSCRRARMPPLSPSSLFKVKGAFQLIPFITNIFEFVKLAVFFCSFDLALSNGYLNEKVVCIARLYLILINKWLLLIHFKLYNQRML